MRMPSLVSIRPAHQTTSLLVSLALIVSGFAALSLPQANATVSVSYDFDNPGDLANNFNSVDVSGAVTQSLTGGINNSGAIATPGSADAVFTSKSSYSMGPIGSTYTFTSFLQSVGNSGYSGMGFTTSSPATTTNSPVYRPADAIGVSVHGGGFVLHNGSTNVDGNWESDNVGVDSIKTSTISELLNSGSPDEWYKVVFVIERDSSTTVDTRIEVWSSSSTGTLLRPSEADAIFEWNDISNPTLLAAPAIYSYINFSGDRVRYFDDYSINLAGGATIIEAGAPVVVTSSATNNNGVVTVEGQVTSSGGTTMVERGFVYGSSTNPTTADTKVSVSFSGGDGTGIFQGVTPTLSAGTYYFRTFATNGSLTSYGSEVEIVVVSAGPQSIANTGFESGLTGWLNGTGVSIITPAPTFNLPTSGFLWQYGVHETKAAKLEPIGPTPTFASTLENNLGLTPSEITSLRASFVGNPTNISWISREVTLQSGTTYRMAWNYTSTDYVPFNDGSITSLVPVAVPGTPAVTINNSETNNRWALLGFTNPGTGMYSTDSYGSTGWQFATYKVSESGIYNLGFASFNINDQTLSPVLLVDDNLGTVTKDGQAFSPVPPNDPTAPSLAQSISPVSQTLSGSTGSAVTPTTAFTASGLVGTVSYAVSAGTLPVGLTLNTSTGVISGTPTAKASGSITITATGSTSGTASATVTFTLKDPQEALTITSTFGTSGTQLTLATSGGSGTGNVTYSVTNGTAVGCSISSGKLTATSAGTCLVTATKAGDADYSPVSSIQTTVTLVAPELSPATQGLSGTTGSPVTPTTAFTASGLVGTVSYAVSAGTLPVGLTLNTSTGVISGTPTAKASGSITITATGSTSGTASATVTFTLKDPQEALTITSTFGTSGTQLTLATSGGSGTGNVTYSVTNGTAVGCSISSGKLTATSAGTCLVTATKAGDADYSPVSSIQTVVRFFSPGALISPLPAPTPSDTNGPPSPKPTPTVVLIPGLPTPSPSPTLGPVNMIPQIEPTPGVFFGANNPIPQILVDILSKPLAYILEQLTGSPLLPDLEPTESMAYENGSPVEIQLVRTEEDNGYVLIGDGWQVALEATDSSGSPLRIDDSGNLILNKDRFVQFSGTGFAPGSMVKVWLFSDPAEVGEVLADASGNFVGEAQLPEGIPAGEHTVQLNGLNKDGQFRSVSLGVVVETVPIVPAPAPFDLSGLMNILWILAAGVVLFFIFAWRRRKKKEEEQGSVGSGNNNGDLIFASEAFEPIPQMPDDSRRRIGPAAPPNRKRFSFKPKNT